MCLENVYLELRYLDLFRCATNKIWPFVDKNAAKIFSHKSFQIKIILQALVLTEGKILILSKIFGMFFLPRFTFRLSATSHFVEFRSRSLILGEYGFYGSTSYGTDSADEVGASQQCT